MPIKMLRIDDRLIHGQIVTAWAKNIQAEKIWIVDDGVAKDDFVKGIMHMVAPGDRELIITGLADMPSMAEKLDSELEKNLDDINNLFGFDSDGDLIIDSGLGFRMDKQLTAYVQSGGIFAMKTTSLDGKIKSSEQKISKLEDQMQSKEAELRNKYGQMEGTLNSLESQQNSIQNFSNSFRRGQ